MPRPLIRALLDLAATADPQIRAYNLKAHAYFLDAELVGVCALEAGDWTGSALPGHTHALVFLVEYGREPRAGEPGQAWIAGTNVARTDVRATEVAAAFASQPSRAPTRWHPIVRWRPTVRWSRTIPSCATAWAGRARSGGTTRSNAAPSTWAATRWSRSRMRLSRPPS